MALELLTERVALKRAAWCFTCAPASVVSVGRGWRAMMLTFQGLRPLR